MRVKTTVEPRSSFLSVDKDLSLITDWMLKNNNLCKLLYYTDREALSHKALTDEQRYDMINKQIKIVPKVYVDNSVLIYIIVTMDNFFPSSNPQFRDNTINFDIICHFDQWHLLDYELRPFRIAAEIDSMFDNQHLTGIGELHFMGMNQVIWNNEYAGLTLMYQATHGGEDKKGAPNPANEENLKKNYTDLFKD